MPIQMTEMTAALVKLTVATELLEMVRDALCQIPNNVCPHCERDISNPLYVSDEDIRQWMANYSQKPNEEIGGKENHGRSQV